MVRLSLTFVQKPSLAVLLLISASFVQARVVAQPAPKVEVDSAEIAVSDRQVESGEQLDTGVDDPPPPPARRPITTDPDAIFRDVFGTERPTLRADNYFILVDSINVGEFFVRPLDGDDGLVDTSFITNILIPIAEPELVERLEPLIADETVAFESLRAVGIDVRFDLSQLVVRVDVPADLRRVRDISLRRARRRGNIQYAEQADVSAFVSVRAGLDFVASSDIDPSGFSGLVSAFDFGVNIGGIAAQGRVRYNERRTRKWSRGDFRLTYDDTDRLIRYELGDLSVGRRPFQIAPRIAGISAFREYPIDPYLNVRPRSEQGFALDQPARVEVFLNGAPVRSFDLPAGRFNLSQFPLIPSAANDVELRITYATGETEILAYPAFYDIELLEPGLLDFAFNVGVPFLDDDRGRVYDDGEYNVLGFARLGVSQVLTLGVNWEGNSNFNTVGGEVVWASPIGSLLVNAGVNINDPSINSGRVSARYAWRDTDTERGRAVDAEVTLTGRDYQTLNQIFGGNLSKLTANVRAGQVIAPRTRAQMFASYEDLRGFGRTAVVGALVSRGFHWGTVSLGGEYRWSEFENELTVRASFTVPLGRRGTVSGNYISERNAVSFDFNRPPAVGVNSFGYSASFERRDDFDRQRAQISYLSNRFDSALIQTRQSGNGRSDVRTGATFGTALVMADGAVALSRPVTNSFAIFEVNAGAADFQIAVEPRTGFGSTETRFTANSGALGPAVIPNLPAYFDRTIEVVAPDAPVGTSVGNQVFSIKPGFMSGFRLKVGSDRNVTLLGILLDSNGSPANLVSGEARELSSDNQLNTEVDPISVFTNASGRFLLEGLKEGSTYEVTVAGPDGPATALITVPDGTVGLYREEQPVTLNAPLGAASGAQPVGEE
ncbi:hypothetical protein [Qipengyuania nanhaisediminis]|uniref:hypothetical protein n=1 Tax=Qipengyuania nanhaisediminis TaxID=604088 RepID=UPI0038B40AAC